MASLMSVRIVRSVEWATAQAIERGESVPRGLDFGTDPASLSKECRAAVLALEGRSEYPTRLACIGYAADGKLSAGYCGWGSVDIELDGEPGEPGFAAALSAAILDAIDRAGEKRRSLERRAELEEAIAAKEAEIAGLRQQLEEI